MPATRTVARQAHDRRDAGSGRGHGAPANARRRHVLRAALAAFAGIGAAGCSAMHMALGSGKRRHIMLDPGHTALNSGAIGLRGIAEVDYNDAFVQLLAQALQAAGHRVSMTRRVGQEISLDERAERANASGADLLLSIHHDSAQPQFLASLTVDGRPAWRTTLPIGGYSLFVSSINPRFAASQHQAARLGEALLAVGRTPTLHHAAPIPGENRALLDARRGLYRFDELVVLRKTTIPAVLLEVGVIVDADDEALVSDAHQRQRMVASLVTALADRDGGPPLSAAPPIDVAMPGLASAGRRSELAAS